MCPPNYTIGQPVFLNPMINETRNLIDKVERGRKRGERGENFLNGSNSFFTVFFSFFHIPPFLSLSLSVGEWVGGYWHWLWVRRIADWRVRTAHPTGRGTDSHPYFASHSNHALLYLFLFSHISICLILLSLQLFHLFLFLCFVSLSSSSLCGTPSPISIPQIISHSHTYSLSIQFSASFATD